jgi:hypothetical protein
MFERSFPIFRKIASITPEVDESLEGTIMSEDEAPKSAVELAMEKLRARSDYKEHRLNDEQKTEIAEIRSRCRAKIAEAEIEMESKLRAAQSLEEIETLRAGLAREKERLTTEMEERVEKVRSGS